MNGLLG